MVGLAFGSEVEHKKVFVLVEITVLRPIFWENLPKKKHECLVLDKDPMWGAFPK
jgi:hypothetical protein